MSKTIKNALICGVGGQDGAYLAQLLITKGYKVWGTSRDAQAANFNNLRALGILQNVHLLSMAPNDFRSVLSTLTTCEPDEVYFLAAQSSVGLSFDQPAETLESICLGTLNMLEAIRFMGKSVKFYHAGSSECFGNIGKSAASETTPFHPQSPYAVAKASAHWLVVNYRDAYGLFACNGILFNHESPLRPQRFVTQKIIATVRRIVDGSEERLKLGRLDIVRDWGWAPEYVNAMWMIMQQSEPDDYVVATGEANSLQDFVAYTFAHVNLDWSKYVDSDSSFFRPSDLEWSQGNPEKAATILGWRASKHMNFVIEHMLSEYKN
jgi:GDPmannose 4,6-dehydratase